MPKSRTEPVTDHAVVRYLERVVGLDIDDIRSQILDPDTQAMLEFVGDNRHRALIPHACGARLVVVNGRIVTVRPPANRANNDT